MSKKPDNKGEQKSANAKRDSIRKLLVGGGVVSAGHMVPNKWTNTVVNSVVLPAHAQASIGGGGDDGSGTGGTTMAPAPVTTAPPSAVTLAPTSIPMTSVPTPAPTTSAPTNVPTPAPTNAPTTAVPTPAPTTSAPTVSAIT